MADNQVRPNVQKLTDDDVQKLLSDALITGKCHQLGPSKVAALAGAVNEKTIRRARDREHTLSPDTMFNLLDADEHILDGILAAKGFMLVPLIGAVAGDVIPTAGAAIHRIGINRASDSPGGFAETDGELIASEPENDALLASVLERRAAIARAKLRRASNSSAA